MSWQKYFHDFQVPEEVTNHSGMIDLSWGNDTCPSFGHVSQKGSDGSNLVQLWCDHPDDSHRESRGFCRFAVTVNDSKGDQIPDRMFTTDDVREALSRFDTEISKLVTS